MKKRIGWLNNKPIIQGDKNLKNSNELHIDELSSSNSRGESGTSKIHYYRFDSNAVAEELISLAYEDDMIIAFIQMYCVLSQGYIYNGSGDDSRGIYYISNTPLIDNIWNAHKIDALVVFEDNYYGDYPYIIKGDLYSKINYFIKYITLQSPEESEMFKNIFDICLKHTTEITEDEFWGMCELPIASLPE